MRHAILQRSLFAFTVALLLVGVAPLAQAQTPGGPYTADGNTVLLLHFDDSGSRYDDASSAMNDGTGFGDITFSEEAGLSGMGLGDQMALNNVDDISDGDTAYVTIPDAASLDLTGDWTIEAWVKPDQLNNESPGSNDIRNPRLLNKRMPGERGDENYEMRFINSPTANFFETRYETVNSNTEILRHVGGAFFEEDTWYHLTYIRDTSQGRLAFLVHNADRELIALGTTSFDPNVDPKVNDQPVFIGRPNRDSQRFLFDGSFDEVRISNTVRSFSAPVITNVSGVGSVTSEQSSYTVSADADSVYGVGSVSDVTLHYSTDGGMSFQTVGMTDGDGDGTYEGDIPAQPTGTQGTYYVTSELGSGERATTQPRSKAFAVVNPASLVLKYDFEDDGMGPTSDAPPKDNSQYNQIAQIVGDPVYQSESSAGAQGDQSLYLDGDDGLIIDPSPALSSPDFTVDVWLKQDQINSGRVLIKEGGRGVTNTDYEPNYQVFVQGADHVQVASAMQARSGFQNNGGDVSTGNTLTPGAWYHVIYQVGEDSTFVQVRNADGSIFQENGYVENDPPLAEPTMGPFKVGFLGNRAYYTGNVDNIQIYNYAAISPDESIVSAGETGTVFENTAEVGARVNFSANASLDDDTLRVMRFDADPGSAGIAATPATSPGGSPVTPTRVSQNRYWQVEDVHGNLTGFTAQACFSTDTLAGVTDRDQLVVVKRDNPGDTWTAQNTTREDVDGDGDNEYLCAEGQASFSQYTLGAAGSGNPLPVELASFEGRADGHAALLTWHTASETANSGFEVQHKREGSWTTIGHREGAGTTTEAQSYTFRAGDLDPGTHDFRLKQVNREGAASYSGTRTVTIGMTERAVLKAAYPNPFRQQATVRFAAREAQPVTLALYDALGRKVRTLYEDTPTAGETQQVVVEAAYLPSGLYLLRLRGEGFTRTRQVVHVK